MVGNVMRGALALALSLICTPLTAAAQTPAAGASSVAALSAEAQDAAKVVDAFHAALKRNDPTAALALLADDALIFEGGYVERSKSEYASHHAGADAAYEAAVSSTLARRSGFADNVTAWIASESRATGRYKDKAVDRLSTESVILRKTADGWRIVHIHWSSRNAT